MSIFWLAVNVSSFIRWGKIPFGVIPTTLFLYVVIIYVIYYIICDIYYLYQLLLWCGLYKLRQHITSRSHGHIGSLTLKAMNLWYGLGAHAYTSTEFFRARTRNLILSYFTADKHTTHVRAEQQMQTIRSIMTSSRTCFTESFGHEPGL